MRTGEARFEATSSNIFNDGNQVNHNQGVSIKHPLQWAASHAGADSTKMGTDGSSTADEVAGALTVATKTLGGVAAVDQFAFKGAGRKKAVSATRSMVNRAKGKVNVDGDWYHKNDIPTLEEEEVAKDGKGGYRFKEGNLEELDKKIDQRRALNPGDKNPHSIEPTKMTSNMAAAVDKTAPIKSPLLDDMGNYTTKEQISTTRDNPNP